MTGADCPFCNYFYEQWKDVQSVIEERGRRGTLAVSSKTIEKAHNEFNKLRDHVQRCEKKQSIRFGKKE